MNTDQEVLEQTKKSLSVQEAKVVRLLRETPWGTVEVTQENGKVVNKKQHKSIKD